LRPSPSSATAPGEVANDTNRLWLESMRESPRALPANGLLRQASSTTMLSPLRAAAIWSTTSAVATASRLNSSPLPTARPIGTR
jgi:hypothetical protein